MRNRISIVSATICLIALTVPVSAVEPGTQGVSPGAPDRFALVAGACPTFSWEATPGAARYELVVHRFDDEAWASSSGELSSETEVLFTTVSGRATSWTPEAADCFAPGSAYVWFVRAVTDPDGADSGEWSSGRFFEVDGLPSPEEVQQALDVLDRYLDSGEDSDGLEAFRSRDRGPLAGAASRSGSSPIKATKTGSRSVITGTAAIRGEQPDPTGETYGVVGVSASPDGAGIGAANTAGGPDLVLDGTVPAELSETGIDRPSASAQSFSFGNSGGGGLTLNVDGVEVVTTATDSDTLDDLSCGSDEIVKWDGAAWICATDDDTDTIGDLSCAANEIAKWDGAAWICAPDDGTDTLGELSCGSDEIAKWDGAAWICAPDDDTDTDTLADLSCGSDEIAKWNGAAWICAPDDDTDTDTVGDLSCGSGQVAKWNGSTWACAADDDTDTDTLGDLSCPSGQIAKRSGLNWICSSDNDTDTLDDLSCGSGQVAKWNGSTWICAADDDSDAIGGLSCGSGQVAKWNGATWICAVDVDTDTNTNAFTMCANGYFLNGDGTCDYSDGSGSCSSGRVCLGGHTHPATEITDGAMDIGNNDYSHSARYGFYHVPGSAFNVTSSSGYYQDAQGYMRPNAGSGSDVYGTASIDIPDGATIIRVTGYYLDLSTTSPTPTYQCSIYRRLNTGYLVSVIADQVISTNWTDEWIVHQVHGTAVSHVVDKSSQAYFLYASLLNTDGSTFFRHYGCRVTYTYANTNN